MPAKESHERAVIRAKDPPLSTLDRRKSQRSLTLPQSPDDTAASIAQQWVLAFYAGGPFNSWPWYVSHAILADEVVSTAAKATLYARQGKICRNEAYIGKSRRFYRSALSLLQRQLCGSSANLICAALLGKYEQMVARDPQALRSHVNGLSAILQCKSSKPETQAIAAVFLHTTKVHRLFYPVARGDSSPFEEDLWLQMDPPPRYCALSEALRSLGRLANQMYIRLPRLVAAVRRARESAARAETPRVDDLSSCLVLVTQLMDTSDSCSESTLLELVITRKAADTADRNPLASFFSFNSKDEMYGMLEYWEARLFVVNLARTILNLLNFKEPRPTIPASAHLDLEAVGHEQSRLVESILQSITAFEKSGHASIAISSSTLIAVWGALGTMDSFDAMPIDEVKGWLFPKCVRALSPGREGFSRQDLDLVSEMFVGGSTDCLFEADSFSQALRSMFFAGGVVSGDVKDLR